MPASASPVGKGETVAQLRTAPRSATSEKNPQARKPLVLDPVTEESSDAETGSSGRAARIGRALAVSGGAAFLLLALGRHLRRRRRRALP